MKNFQQKFHKLRMISSILKNKNISKIGPLTAQIDITNRCNNKCIACWARSPLLKELEASKSWQSYELPFNKVKELLYSLGKLHVKKVFFSGGGEPFMHPDIPEILDYSKKKGFEVDINTNFILIDKKIAKKLVSLEVNHLNVSLWSGDAQTYTRLHPTQSKKTFHSIIETLKYLNKIKENSPQITIVNVITNLNFENIKSMVKLAFDTKSELIDFVMVDTKEKTDELLLNQEQITQLFIQLKNIPRLLNIYERKYGHKINIPLLEQLIEKLSSADAIKGIYYKGLIESAPCYAGWLFTRISANGNVDPCLKAYRIPVGNIHKNTFEEIWNSELQKNFREKTNNFKKTDAYFLNIGEDTKKKSCYTSCDNFNENLNLFNDISKLNNWQKRIIKLFF